MERWKDIEEEDGGEMRVCVFCLERMSLEKERMVML